MFAAHFYEKHDIRCHRNAGLEWCYLCQEWYYNVSSQGNFVFWEAHCESHYEILFSRFSERAAGSIDNMSSIILIDDKFVEFELGEGFGGSRPEFHGHIDSRIVRCPFFCPFCVYDTSKSYSVRLSQ